MGFGAPFWLLLALSGLGVLYLHVRRRKSFEVPSLMLWQRIASGRTSKRPLRLPPWSLALLLQLAAILVVALALAEPRLGNNETSHRVFVVDAAALPSALAEVKRQLAVAPPDERHVVSLVAAGPAPRVVAARIADGSALDTALGWIAPQDGGVDRMRTNELVASLGKDGEATAVAWVEGPERTALEADLARQGESWRAAGSVRVPEGGARPAAINVLFMPEGAPGFLDWADVPLNFDGQVATFSTDLALPGGGVVSLRLPDGDMGLRYLVRSEPAPTRVLYLGQPTPAVVRALQAMPGTSLFQADQLPDTDAGFDLVVVDNTTVPRRPATNALHLGTGHVEGDSTPAPIAAAAATQWQAAHALSKNVDWTGLSNLTGFAVGLQPGAETVLAVAGQPLVTARTLRTGREVAIGIDLKVTGWVDDPSYVALMSNIMRWAGLGQEAGVVPPCVTGSVCAVPARLLGGSVSRVPETVLAQGDQAASALLLAAAFGEDGWLAPGLDRAFVPETAGLYRVTTADGLQALLAVNPAPVGAVEPDAPAVQAAAAGSLSAWWLLLGMGLVLMAGEFALSHLRQERLVLVGKHPRVVQNRWLAAMLALALVFVVAAMAGVPVPQLAPGRQVAVAATPAEAESLRLQTGGDSAVSMGTGERPGGDAGDALMLAAASVPAGQNGRILLDWDGNETRGNLATALKVLGDRGIAVDVAPEGEAPQAVSVEDLAAPSKVFAGDAFVLNAMVESWVAQPQKIEILRDGQVVATQDADLAAGVNRIEAAARAEAPGLNLYEVRVAGTESSAGVWIRTEGPPKVAILAGQDEASQSFAKALQLQNLAVTILPPNRAPASLDGWLEYDAVVTMDLPATALAPRQQEQLESAVRDRGLGLLLLGGPNTFGPGGYYETPFEAMSPLSSRVPRNAPKTGFVFVLDRSGSMQRDEGGTDRLTIAKAATLNATGLLNPQSQVGIVAFDTTAYTVLPLHAAGDEPAIRQALSQVDAGGGTAVYPALADAIEMLKGVDLPKRHIVVISDGLTQPGDFPGLLAEARAADITVSAIAIGDAADPTSLSHIAELGGGAFHWSRDFRALPGILAQETMLSSASPIKERAVTPQWVNRSDAFLKGAPDSVPPLAGYVDTTAKPRAHLQLATSDEDGNVVPIMASWRYGAGQVLALATQASGAWSAQWSALPNYPGFWAQIVRGVALAPEGAGLGLTLVRAGDEVVVQTSGERPAVTFAGPASGLVPMAQVASGQWEGRFPVLADGDYEVAASAGKASADARMHITRPAALSAIGGNSDKREVVARISGGTLSAEGVGERAEATWTLTSGWRLWALLAAACFLASLALRYLPGLVSGRTPSKAAVPRDNRIEEPV